MDFIDGARRGTAIFFGIHLFVKRRCANQMMRGLRERCPIRFCRQEIEPAIYLKCIRADNFGTNFMRDIGGELGFAGRCGAEDEEGACHQSRNATPNAPRSL